MYFFSISFQRQQLLWEQEMYHQLKYKIPRKFFHTFEADVSLSLQENATKLFAHSKGFFPHKCMKL